MYYLKVDSKAYYKTYLKLVGIIKINWDQGFKMFKSLAESTGMF